MGMTVGVCGVKHPHAGGHLAALDQAPEIDTLLVWDEDKAAAREVAERLTTGVYADAGWEAVLKNSAVPAVCVLLPDREAGPRTLEAIEAGKWVYGDKPGAQTAAELELIVQAAAAHGVHFCPCYSQRNRPQALEIAELLQRGAIGRLWSFNCQWITSQISLRGPANWLFHKEFSAGGILTWLGCHWLDLLRVLIGCEVTEVMAMVATQTEQAVDVEDTAAMILRFSNGAVGTLRAGYSLNPFAGYDDSDYHFQFEGSQGALTWYPRRGAGYRLRSSNPEFSPFGAARDVVIDTSTLKQRPGYSGDFLAAFLQAVITKGTPPATARDALAVMKVIEAAYESSRSGQAMRLNQ